MEWIKGIIIGLITTLIGYILSVAYRNRSIHIIIDKLISLAYHQRQYKTNTKININKLRPQLLRRLRKDQYRKGVRYGQFGKTCDFNNLAKFCNAPENSATKLNMYLTLWPCIILNKYKSGQRMVSIATNGIIKLYKNDRIIAYQSAIRQTIPYNHPTMIHYRHTICGALLLYHVNGLSDIVTNILDGMIDPGNTWQNLDGGWAALDYEYNNSDLWGSAYAIHFLGSILCSKENKSEYEIKLIENAIRKTTAYLKQQWDLNKWEYGGVSSQENSVGIICQVADFLKLYQIDLLSEVIDFLKNYLTPGGFLKESYINKCKNLSEATIFSRFSYAMYKCNQGYDVWYPLFVRSLHHFDQYIDSANLSFLYDLSYSVFE